MRRLLVILLLVVAILAVGDLLLRSWVESRIESSAREELDGVAAVGAAIGGYPFLPRLLFSGEVSSLDIDLAGITGDPIDVQSIHLAVKGLRFDRTDLFFDSRATVIGVDVVRITAVVGEDEVRQLTGLDLELGDGRAIIRLAGQEVVAAASVQDGQFVFEAGPLPDVAVPLPGLDLLPCAVEGRIIPDGVELTCTTDRLPPRLIQAIGSIDLQDALD